MAKKSEKEDRKKTLALIFVEGDTEVDFYNKMKEHLRHKLGGKLACEVKIHNLKGVGQEHWGQAPGRKHKQILKSL